MFAPGISAGNWCYEIAESILECDYYNGIQKTDRIYSSMMSFFENGAIGFVKLLLKHKKKCHVMITVGCVGYHPRFKRKEPALVQFVKRKDCEVQLLQQLFDCMFEYNATVETKVLQEMIGYLCKQKQSKTETNNRRMDLIEIIENYGIKTNRTKEELFKNVNSDSLQDFNNYNGNKNGNSSNISGLTRKHVIGTNVNKLNGNSSSVSNDNRVAKVQAPDWAQISPSWSTTVAVAPVANVKTVKNTK